MYSEKVMDHFSNPRNVGQIDNANAVGEVGNAKCGDIMKIYMDIQDDVIRHSVAVRLLQQVQWQLKWLRVRLLTRHLLLQIKRLWRHLTDFRKKKFTALFLLKRLFSLQSTITEAKRGKYRLKIIVTSVTRNVTIQTNNPIKYNIKTDKTLLFCLFLRL